MPEILRVYRDALHPALPAERRGGASAGGEQSVSTLSQAGYLHDAPRRGTMAPLPSLNKSTCGRQVATCMTGLHETEHTPSSLMPELTVEAPERIFDTESSPAVRSTSSAGASPAAAAPLVLALAPLAAPLAAAAPLLAPFDAAGLAASSLTTGSLIFLALTFLGMTAFFCLDCRARVGRQVGMPLGPDWQQPLCSLDERSTPAAQEVWPG